MKKHLTWDTFFNLVCILAAFLVMGAIIGKFMRVEALTDISIERLFIILGVIFVLPYVTRMEAFGVKFEMRKKVESLSDTIQALPDYVLASEYEAEEDWELAETAYNTSLRKCSEFWPSLFGLGSVYDSQEKYAKAIAEYNKVIKLDPENVYAHNNLAGVYVSAPNPLRDPKKARDMADKALAVIPDLGSAMYYKAEALNRETKYAEAYAILTGLREGDKPSGQSHWVHYELSIASSHKNEHLSRDVLEASYLLAQQNDAGKEFVDGLDYDLKDKRHSGEDEKAVKAFVDRHVLKPI